MLQRSSPPAAPPEPPTGSDARPWAALGLAFLVALPFLGGLGSSLVYDDHLLLGQQPLLGDPGGLYP